MKLPAEPWLCIFAGLALYFPCRLEAAPIRFALLTDPAALSDTIDFLRNAGCARQALRSFESLASNRTARLSVNLRNFPTATRGFYGFTNLEALLDALSTNDMCAGAIFDFNCFDTVTLLAGAKLQTTLKPDEISGPFLIWNFSTNSGSRPWLTAAATPRDAFIQNYAQYYQSSSERFPENMRDSHMSLTAALFGVYFLPRSSSTNCSDAVLPVLEASWRRNGVRFPSNFEVLLLHRTEGLMLRTSHAGLVFPRGRKFTYIEKTSWAGHFVRLDVDDIADIMNWVGSLQQSTNTSERLFVTLNETISELVFAPPRQQPNTTKPTGN